jgi:ATPase subunit of ABC transporter with duplicated ATPase domains
MLLDEPTNHLDVSARSWLEDYLRDAPAAIVVVSHDRRFLERSTSRILDLRRRTLTAYEGGYEWYREQRALENRQAWEQFHAQERRVKAAARAAAERMRVARAAVERPAGQRERFGGDHFRAKAAKVERTANVIRARAEREPEAAKPVLDAPIPTLKFPRLTRIGEPAVRFDGVAKAFGDCQVFSTLTLSVARGERVAIAGPNGAGKTTLLRMVVGSVAPDSGAVRLGAGARVGYFAQDADNLDPEQTALGLCLPLTPDRSFVHTLLACLRLDPVHMNAKVGTLSAGERAKVALARVLLVGPNLLLLDEPTNHLDIDAREAIEATLRDYPGTMLLVSHDRSFVTTVATRVIYVGGG